MKAATLLLSLLLFMRTTYAGWDNWSDTDRTLFIASSVAMAADWATTRYASRQWDTCNCHERNPILGKHPSTGRLDLYFTTMMIANYYIGDAMGPEWRPFYFAFRTAAHGSAAYHNTAVFGWQLRF